MTRKTRIWCGWLSLIFGVILTDFTETKFFYGVENVGIRFAMSALPSAIIVGILLCIFWLPVNYDPFNIK